VNKNKTICILCGQPLNEKGKKINREHYVPQVLIRNFKKLRIPSAYTHALRIDLRTDDGEILLAPLSCHKEWATVKVHEQCNLDASLMCQDLKFIIEHHLKDDDPPPARTKRIIEYYNDLWGGDKEPDLDLTVLPNEVVDGFLEEDQVLGASLIYDPGYLWVGKLMIQAPADQILSYEKHSIYLGTEKGLLRLIDEIAQNESPSRAVSIE
jgi:hypothetical protein